MSAQKSALDQLTPKRRAFVKAYVSTARFNGTQAALQAGYAKSGASVEGTRLLADAKVQAALKEVMEPHALTQQRVAAELAKLALTDPTDFLRKTKNGWRFDLDRAIQAGIVTSVRRLKLADGRVADIELHDRMRALVALGKAHGMFKSVSKQDEGDGVLRIVLVDESRSRQER